jgi:hypothetical protein
MAKGYVIEEIRASVRLRDPKSGSVIDVPLALGDHWTPPPHRKPSRRRLVARRQNSPQRSRRRG